MAERPNQLEKAVMELLLSREESGYGVLRKQLADCRVCGRDMTGHGFFTELTTDAAIPAAPAEVGNPVGEGRAFPDDVYAEIDGLDQGAGFLLWLEDGRLATLEGYSFIEPWPDDVRNFTVRWISLARHMGTGVESFD